MGRWLGLSFLILTAVALAFYLGQRRTSVSTPVKIQDSIAVLPFDTASLDPELVRYSYPTISASEQPFFNTHAW
jgi:hypothetical protein